MTPDDPSLADCLTRLSEGDQAAARQIYERFVDRLIHLAARRLDRQLGAKADPESVAHSVFESFFERQQAGQFSLHNWGMVFGLLSHITFRKCLSRNRDLRREKRGGDADAVSFEDWQKAAAAPGPDEAAMVAEALEAVLARFDPDARAVLDVYLAGNTVEAVAAQVKLTTRTVQRVLERFRKQLLDQLRAD